MKKSIFYVLSAIVAVMTLSSCSGEDGKVVKGDGASFEIQSLDDFLWKKDIAETISFTITTNFIECDSINDAIVLALCDSKGNVIDASKVSMMVNGQKSEDNRICIPTVNGEHDTKVDLVLNKSLLNEDCVYDWYIKLISDAGLAKVFCENNGVTGQINVGEPRVDDMHIRIKNDHVVNPLTVWTNLVLWIVLAALVAWHVMSRIVNPSVRFTRVTINYGDTEMKYDTRRCYKVILTNKPLKFGLFHRFFVGKVCVICNEFWDTQATLKMGYKDHLKVITKGDYDIPDEMKRKEDFVIKNEAGKKATLLTN